MKKNWQSISLLLSSLFLVLSIPAVHADSFVDSQDRSKPEPVTYVEIFADTEGHIVLAADTTGKGHITQTIGNSKAVFAAVP